MTRSAKGRPNIIARAGRLALVALAMAMFHSSLPAVAPVLWTVETLDEFDRGRPEGVSIGATGELTLSPALLPLNLPSLDQSSEPFLWSLVVDSKGNVFVGGGRKGSIYRVPRGAAGALYYESGDLAVHALAVDKGDVLYAGTMPQGRILKITGEGKGEVFYQPEDRYIWALAVSGKGELFAATGERGIIYRVGGPGKAETFFDSEESHIVALAIDPQGNVLAGSDGRGLLYRITPAGKPSVLHDSALREISAVVVDPRGTIYAAAIGSEGETPLPLPTLLPVQGARETGPAVLPGQPPVALPGIEEGTTPTVTVTTVSAVAVPQGPPAKSEVYRIDPDGTVVTLWSSPSEVVYSLALDPAGRPVIGTGEPGRIRLITGAQQSTLLAKLPQSQVTSLAMAGRQIFAASSNIGKVYVLDPGQADSGTYLSEAHDARSVARWGRVAWRAGVPAGSRIEIQTRTGNSAVPDSTWSEWSSAYATADGSAVSSPPGRFLQWRARLARTGSGDGPVLQEVSVSYVQGNLPPVVKRLALQPPGVVRERSMVPPEVDPADLAFTGLRPPGDGSSPGSQASQAEKRVYSRGMRAMEWDADDPNGDLLTFDLLFRGDGESAWKPLARSLREGYFAFDSMQIPDGLYRVRLDATDAPSNPGDKARIASLTSESFLIDNTPPQVQVTARKGSKPGTVSIEVAATDTIGPVSRADASIDAGRFNLMQAADGVGDSRAESYSLTFEGLRAGEHTVIVRVSDLLGNIGAGKATFTTD